MNQQIKISKQSAKVLGNYAECKFHEFHSNNILLVMLSDFTQNFMNFYYSKEYF